MLRTMLAWPLGAAATAVWATLSLAASLVDPSGRWAHRCMVAWSRHCLFLMGTRLEVSGLEHVRRDSAQVFAANHQSLADILVLAAALPVGFRFVAKRELFEVPFLGWHMRRAGFIPIDRANPREAARVLLRAAERVRAGVNAAMFPEGTRSPDGRLLPFRGGAFLLAQRAGVPVVPIAIEGTGQIVRKGERRIRQATARLSVLPAIEPGRFGDDRDALAAAVRAALEARLAPAPPPTPTTAWR